MHESLAFAIVLERGFTTQSATGSGKVWAEIWGVFTQLPVGLIPHGGFPAWWFSIGLSQNDTWRKQGQCWRLSQGWRGRQWHVGRLVADAAAEH